MSTLRNAPDLSLARVTFINLVVSAIGSLLAYLSYMYMAYRFGAKSDTDIFFFAVTFIGLLSALITTVFSTIFLPLAIQLRTNNTTIESDAFVGNFLSWLIILVIFISTILLIYTYDVFALFSKFNQINIEENLRTLRYFSFIFGATIINEFYRVLLQSSGEFKAPAISNVFLPVISILCIYGLSEKLSIESLAVAMLISRVLQFAYLLKVTHDLGIRVKLSLRGNKYIGKFINLGYVYWFASFITMFSGYYFEYAATGLSEGSLTAISYAQKIYLIPLALLAMPVLEILSTTFAVLYANNKKEQIQSLYQEVIFLTLFVMVPLSFILFEFNVEIVRIMFGRGQFGEESIAVTASALSIYSIALPLLVLFQLNGRIAMTFQINKLPSILGSIGHILMVITTWWAVSRFDYLGIPLAKTGIELLYFLPLGFFCAHLCLGSFGIRLFFKELLKIILFACIAIFVSRFTLDTILTEFAGSSIYTLTAGAVIFFSIYYTLCRYGGVQSIKPIEEKFRQCFIK